MHSNLNLISQNYYGLSGLSRIKNNLILYNIIIEIFLTFKFFVKNTKNFINISLLIVQKLIFLESNATFMALVVSLILVTKNLY